jgi:LPXTG-site transpeptidase (sortase) family protein
VHAFGQVYTYAVRESERISPVNVGAALKHEDEAWLTLLTCEDYQFLGNHYSGRRLVRAVLVNIE